MRCLVHKLLKGPDKGQPCSCKQGYRKRKCRCDNCRAWKNESLKNNRRNIGEDAWKAKQKRANKKYFSSVKGKTASLKNFYKRYNRTKAWMLHWTDENHAAWEALVVERERLNAETGVAHDIDHIVPLNVGGPHHPANCRVITAHENRSRPKDGSDLAYRLLE